MSNLKKDNLTESDSLYNHLEQMSTQDLLTSINREDQKVAQCIQKVIPQIEALVDEITVRMKKGGRLFYIGAGTSGRLGIVDASECPPTFGVPEGRVVGLIAGGDQAIRKAVEYAEDDTTQGWKDLEKYAPTAADSLIGLAASGRTPYVIGAIKEAKTHGLLTGAITCNIHTPLSKVADHPLEVAVGPEFVTGSTRMKAGSAQKMVLNMISTSIMIKLGHIQGNKMVDMQLTNHKLQKRAIQMIQQLTSLDKDAATHLLKKYGSVRKVVEELKG